MEIYQLSQQSQLQIRNKSINFGESNISIYSMLVVHQINCGVCTFYFGQLEAINDSDEKIACIKIKDLNQIDNQIKYLQEVWDQINIKEYINQQYDTNMGIYNYFLSYYKNSNEINQNIEKYYQLKSHIGFSLNQIEQFKTNPNPNQIEEFNSLKKKKQIIIHKIIETQFYQRVDIDKKDQSFIKSQIEEIGQLGYIFHQQKQYELALRCYELKIKFNPNDPSNSDYYYKKGSSLYQLKRYEEAVAMYDKAIQLNPQNPSYYNNKGQRYYLNL